MARDGCVVVFAQPNLPCRSFFRPVADDRLRRRDFSTHDQRIDEAQRKRFIERIALRYVAQAAHLFIQAQVASEQNHALFEQAALVELAFEPAQRVPAARDFLGVDPRSNVQARVLEGDWL